MADEKKSTPQPIEPDILQKVLRADIGNLIKKVKDGRSLTKDERAMLQAMATKNAQNKPLTLEELAEQLGTTRKTLQVWRKLDGSPKADTNGHHSVALWREFISSRGLGSKTLGSREEQLMDAEGLRARKLLAEVEDRELKVLIRKGQYVSIDAVKERWFYHIGQANALLRNKLENELPPILVGRDAVDMRKYMARVVDEYIGIMNSGDQKKIPKLETRGRKKSND